MRTLLGLLIVVILGFTSCEGRKTQSQALAEDIEEFKKNVSIEIDVYKPESYIEREVDSLLNNGYRVKIKTYTDMENSILFTKIKDTINYQTYYRNFKFDILVEKDGKTIFNKNFNKDKIKTILKYDPSSDIKMKDFDELAILKSVELNDDFPYSESIKIEIMYAIPETNKQSLHVLSIDDKGQMKIERKEENK